MRVCFLTDTYRPQVNGLVTSISTSRQALQRLGCEVLILAPWLRSQEPEPGVHRLLSLPYLPQPEYTWVLPWGLGFDLRAFAHLGCDLIHSHANFGAGLIAIALARRHRLPLVMTYHTSWEDYVHYVPLPGGFVRWANRHYSRWLCNRCDLVLAPTQRVRQMLQGYGVRARLEILPSGLDAEVFSKTEVGKVAFGAKPGQKLLSCAGRLGREKRMDLLLRALAIAFPQLPDWRLCIAGDGPERQNLMSLVRELGLSNRVDFLGYLPRHSVLDLMEASDLFTFPSVSETQGLVVLEAMGRGTPVVAADAMGVGEVMQGGYGGWLARPDDAADFAAKLLQALTDETGYQKKQAEALELAGRYTAEELNRRLLGYYQEILFMHPSLADQ